jgi:tetratricopeptide (TPR) repeat protein
MAKNQNPVADVQHDEVAESVHETVEFIKRHGMSLVIVVVIIFAGILVKIALNQREASRLSEINTVINESLADLAEIAAPQLDAPIRRQQADQLTARLDALYENYPDEPLAQEALFLKGGALFLVDDFSGSQQAYQRYIEASVSNDRQARGEIALGYAYENEAYLTTATTTQRARAEAGLGRFQRAESLASGTFLSHYALLGQARIQEALGDNQAAAALYQRVIDERPAPAESAPSTDESQLSDPMIQYLKTMLDGAQSQLSFQRTAQLRLDRLKALMGEANPTEETATATP